MKQLDLPKRFFNALTLFDYTSLSEDDVYDLNLTLLENDVSFTDVKKVRPSVNDDNYLYTFA